MKYLLLVSGLLLMFIDVSAQAADVIGKWYDKDGNLTITIYKAGPDYSAEIDTTKRVNGEGDYTKDSLRDFNVTGNHVNFSIYSEMYWKSGTLTGMNRVFDLTLSEEGQRLIGTFDSTGPFSRATTTNPITLFLRSAGGVTPPPSASQSTPQGGATASDSCSSFCENIKRVLQERASNFRNLKGNPAPGIPNLYLSSLKIPEMPGGCSINAPPDLGAPLFACSDYSGIDDATATRLCHQFRQAIPSGWRIDDHCDNSEITHRNLRAYSPNATSGSSYDAFFEIHVIYNSTNIMLGVSGGQ